MDWLGDLFNSPYLIIIIGMGLLAILAIMAKSTKARKLGKVCGIFVLFCIWIQVVESVIMPNSGLTAGTTNYDALRSILCLIPMLYFIFKTLKS